MVPHLLRSADAPAGVDPAGRRLRPGAAAVSPRLVLILTAVLALLGAAGGLYLKGRHDADARERPKTEAALAKAAVAGLETQGAQQSAQRVEVVVRQRDAANRVVAGLMSEALKSEDANAPLDPARVARLRNADDGLCVADAELAGCATNPDAAGGPEPMRALPPAVGADQR